MQQSNLFNDRSILFALEKLIRKLHSTFQDESLLDGEEDAPCTLQRRHH